jgi:hypothetical protein
MQRSASRVTLRRSAPALGRPSSDRSPPERRSSPAGTGNDFARGIGVPLKDPAAAADLIVAGKTRTIDLAVAKDGQGRTMYNAIRTDRAADGRERTTSCIFRNDGGRLRNVAFGEVDVDPAGKRSNENSFNLEDSYCQLRPSGVDPSKDPCKRPWDIDAYRASWGFGLRWFSPIGPLRFEWGIPFRTLRAEQPIVFEFTIGNFF